MLSIEYPKKQEDQDKIDNFVAQYEKHCKPKMLKERDEISFEDLSDTFQVYERPEIGACTQFKTLLDRNWVALYRNPLSLYGRLFTAIMIQLTTVCLYWKMGYDPDE